MDGVAQAGRGLRLERLNVDYPSYRRQVIFDCFKWDPQVGDVNTVCDEACVLAPDTLATLARDAEALARETEEIERALRRRPRLYAELGIPHRLRGVLAREPDGRPTRNDVRVCRFDFHPTTTGWAVSEVNSDVPGGFSEASALPRLAAQHVPHSRPAGDVASALAGAFINRLPSRGRIAFVHATAYADDRQVMAFLAQTFSEHGFECVLAAPDHLSWSGGLPKHANGSTIDGVVRFFPAEWLPNLPRRSGWKHFFQADCVSCNDPGALLTQSKRLPLLWDRLGLAVPAWRRLLPETRDPRDAPWRSSDEWLIKPAFGRVGEDVAWRGSVPANDWRRIRWSARFEPRAWVAQRRFESHALHHTAGVRHLCIGVFTVDGKASGFYGRLSTRPRIDQHAQDIAVLVSTEPEQES